MPKSKTDEKRWYPSCCTSYFCDQVDCTGCGWYPTLREFKEWVKANNAEEPDPIWNRNYFVARRKCLGCGDLYFVTEPHPYLCRDCDRHGADAARFENFADEPPI